MRILLSFLQDKTAGPHPIPAYRFWEFYIKNGIEEAGMSYLEVPETDWAEGLTYADNSPELSAWKEKTWLLTLQYVKANLQKIDIFLTYLYPKQVDTLTIEEIKKLGIPCVNFYCDNIREFTKVPDEFKYFDLIWVPEYEALPMYKKAGINHINLPMPMWVERQWRGEFVPTEKLDISFIGSKDILREQLLAEAINKGLPLNISGNGWLSAGDVASYTPTSRYQKVANQYNFVKQHGLKGLAVKTIQRFNPPAIVNIDKDFLFPSPDFNTYVDITQNSKVVLGISRVPTFKRLNSNPLTYSRLRDIEAPMLGACYLTEYSEGLTHLYDLENEVYAYKNVDELVSKASELLNDSKRRNELRINGQKRALSEHSIPKSLLKIKAAILGNPH